MAVNPAAPTSADVVLVCPHLGDGGAQRVVCILARFWSEQGRRVCVVTLYEEEQVYELAPGVSLLRVHDHPAMQWLEKVRAAYVNFRFSVRSVLYKLFGTVPRTGPGSVWGFIKRPFIPLGVATHFTIYVRVRALRSMLRNTGAGVVIGFCGSTNVMLVMAARGLGCRTVISERNDPGRQRLTYPWDHLRRRYYDGADVVTANSRGALEVMRAYVGADKLVYAPNPLFRPDESTTRPDARTVEAPTVLIVGRLHYQKAHDVLLDAFAGLDDDLDHWRLSVVGQGEEEQNLRRRAAALEISARVSWHGQVKDPFSFYRQAGIFSLASRHEGTPNSLLEAMSCGMAVIVSDASPGPLELVEDGVNGIVVPAGDPVALARGITTLARDPDLRSALGRRAKRTVTEYTRRALKTWDGLLEPAT